jgi:putative inorganic carbon (hco3(-)) transporter
VLRIVEAGLGAAIWIAVLGFGGGSTPLFCLAQLTILLLGIFVLLSSLPSPLGIIRLPCIVPVLLMVLVLLQIVPFPASLATLFRAQHEVFQGHASFTLSLAPYQTVSHLLLLVTYWTGFCLTLMICEDRRARTRLLYVLLALGTFEALYGLLQYLTGWQQIFAYVKKYYLEDATGTYINRNHFAGLLEMVLPFAVALGLQRLRTLGGVAWRPQARARAVLSARGLFPLVFAVFLCVIMFTALIFSRSRMGIASATASLLAVFLCVTMYSRSERTHPLMAALLALGVMGLVVWIGSDPVITRFETLGQEYSQAGQNRISIWSDTLKLVRQHPLVGTGLGTFSVAYPSVQTTFLNHRVDHAHCDYLEVTSDLGLVGAVLVFGSIVWVLAHAVRACGKVETSVDNVVRLGCIGSITAILVHSFADFNLYIPGNALVFSVIVALAWSTILREREADKKDLRGVHTRDDLPPCRLVAKLSEPAYLRHCGCLSAKHTITCDPQKQIYKGES